jgi:hypothetical protein
MSKRKLMAIKIFGIGGRLFKSIGRSSWRGRQFLFRRKEEKLKILWRF